MYGLCAIRYIYPRPSRGGYFVPDRAMTGVNVRVTSYFNIFTPGLPRSLAFARNDGICWMRQACRFRGMNKRYLKKFLADSNSSLYDISG